MFYLWELGGFCFFSLSFFFYPQSDFGSFLSYAVFLNPCVEVHFFVCLWREDFFFEEFANVRGETVEFVSLLKNVRVRFQDFLCLFYPLRLCFDVEVPVYLELL